MKTLIESCDLCGKLKKPIDKTHWSEWGPVKLQFKSHPGIQSDIDFELICVSCAKKIEAAVFAVLKEFDSSSKMTFEIKEIVK